MIDRRELPRQILFELSVFASCVTVFAQVVPKSQCAALFDAAHFNDVNVMSVGPLGRPMEEGTE